MSSSDSKPKDVFADFRREGESLRKMGSKKGTLTEPRRQELVVVVGRAISSEAPFDKLEADLLPFPPRVVGRATAAVWATLEAQRKTEVIQRVRKLDSERLMGEVLPMAVHLLRSSATAKSGSEVLGILPLSEKVAHRVATEILGDDGIAVSALQAPENDHAATAMFRVLLKAAAQEEAQPFRQLQLLRLVVPWLVERGRYSRAEMADVLSQVRELARRLDGSVNSEWAQDLAKEESWAAIFRRSSVRPAPASPTQLQAVPQPSIAPNVPAAPEVAPVSPGPERTLSRDSEGQLTLEEALSTVRSLRDRRARESRALDRVLESARAAETQIVQNQRDVQEARDRERKATLELDKATRDMDRLKSELSQVSESRAEARREARDSQEQCRRLTIDLTNEQTRISTLLAEQERNTTQWNEQRHQLETQVVENADARLSELRQRVGSRLAKVLADIPPATADMKGNDAAAVLHTRIHELLALLRREGVPVDR